MQVNVVNRQLVAVLTTGTLTDAEMLSGHPDASYLLALTEMPLPRTHPGLGRTPQGPSRPEATVPRVTEAVAAADAPPDAADANITAGCSSPVTDPATEARVMMGACFIDVATSQILMGQW